MTFTVEYFFFSKSDTILDLTYRYFSGIRINALFQLFKINFGEKTDFCNKLVNPYIYNNTEISLEISIDKCRSKIHM